MSSPGHPARHPLPPVDEHLVVPETPYEMDDGKLVYVPPANEPHATLHVGLGALLQAHRAAAFNVAVDMLTRTSANTERAPDASVYPSARDPVTGGRQLEELAFEIVSTQRLSDASKKARQLAGRGVRRLFAIDLARARVLEWSRELDDWMVLPLDEHIVDPALAVPLPVALLLDTTRADDGVAQALRARRHPAFLAEREEGRVEGLADGRLEILRKLLALKFGALPPDAEARLASASAAELDRYLERVLFADALADVLG